MTDTGRTAAASIRDHAVRIEELRLRLEAVRFTSTLMDRGKTAEGSVFAWLNECLEHPVQRQDGIVEYLTVNLKLAERKLQDTADAYEGRPGAPALATVTAVSYWASKGQDAPKVDFGAKPRLAAKIEGLKRTMAVQSWAAGALAEPQSTQDLERDCVTIDSVFLHDLATTLQFQPEFVAAQVLAWNNMSTELHEIAQELQDLLEHDMPEWNGAAHAAYCWLMDHNVNSAIALSATAAGLAAAIEGVSIVVTSTLARIREQNSNLAAHLITGSAHDNGRGMTVQQLVAVMMQWAATVARIVAALAQSLVNLKMRLPSANR